MFLNNLQMLKRNIRNTVKTWENQVGTTMLWASPTTRKLPQFRIFLFWEITLASDVKRASFPKHLAAGYLGKPSLLAVNLHHYFLKHLGTVWPSELKTKKQVKWYLWGISVLFNINLCEGLSSDNNVHFKGKILKCTLQKVHYEKQV